MLRNPSIKPFKVSRIEYPYSTRSNQKIPNNILEVVEVKFVVRVEVNNLLLSNWAKKSLGPAAESSTSLGCYATRIVEATNQDEAILNIMQSIHKELIETSVISPIENPSDNPITVKLDSIRMVPVGAEPNAPEAGFTFYPE